MGRGRKPSGTIRIGLTLHLHPEYHKDLLDLLANSPNKARLVAEGLYAILYGADGKQDKPTGQDNARDTVDALLENWNF